MKKVNWFWTAKESSSITSGAFAKLNAFLIDELKSVIFDSIGTFPSVKTCNNSIILSPWSISLFLLYLIPKDWTIILHLSIISCALMEKHCLVSISDNSADLS